MYRRDALHATSLRLAQLQSTHCLVRPRDDHRPYRTTGGLNSGVLYLDSDARDAADRLWFQETQELTRLRERCLNPVRLILCDADAMRLVLNDIGTVQFDPWLSLRAAQSALASTIYNFNLTLTASANIEPDLNLAAEMAVVVALDYTSSKGESLNQVSGIYENYAVCYPMCFYMF